MTTEREMHQVEKPAQDTQDAQASEGSGWEGLFNRVMQTDEARAVFTKCFDETKKARIEAGDDPSKLPEKVEFKNNIAGDQNFLREFKKCTDEPLRELLYKELINGMMQQTPKDYDSRVNRPPSR